VCSFAQAIDDDEDVAVDVLILGFLGHSFEVEKNVLPAWEFPERIANEWLQGIPR